MPPVLRPTRALTLVLPNANSPTCTRWYAGRRSCLRSPKPARGAGRRGHLCMLQSALMPNLDSVIQQLRAERDRLDRAIAALESMANSTAPRRAARRTSARTGRRTMSLAARRRMAAAQRERWKRGRASQRSVNERSVGRKAVSRSNRKRRHLSPQGLARIRAAQRKRWAKVRAGKKK